ncbi:MAG: hypothetical protein ABSA75_12880 [Candidatus Bathyarchaeia archaeon]|jgi:uncharacterized surface protein with fasciclin (FAS1) repeats
MVDKGDKKRRIVDTAVEARSFKTLIALVQACRKGGHVEKQRQFTVFAARAGTRWFAKSDFG